MKHQHPRGASVPHGNTQHGQTYVNLISGVAMLYAAADQAVSAAAVTTLGTRAVTITAGNAAYLIWLGGAVNFRPGTITVDAQIDFWLEVDAIQRTAKMPVTCAIAIPTKLPFTMPLIAGTAFDLIFWLTGKQAGTYTVTLKAQRRATADPAANTILVSDVSGMVLIAQGDIA